MTTVSMNVEERTCLIGGQSRSRTMFGVPWWVIGVVAANLAFWLLLFLVVRQIWMLPVGCLSTVAGWWLLRKVDAVGDSWVAAVVDRYSFSAARRRGRLNWDPEPGRVPATVGPFLELVWRQRTGPGGVVTVVHHPTSEGGFAEGSHFTAVLEIVGGGDGMREIAETNARGERFGRLLAGLTSAEIPVDQLDLETRILPEVAGAYEDKVMARLAPDCPPLLRESMAQLATLGANATEKYRSFATVRMPYEGVVKKAGGAGADEEAVTTATLDTVRRVTERLQRSGHRVHGVLGSRRVAAMIRHMYVPDFAIDDTIGLSDLADGFAWAYRVEPEAVVVDAGELGEWWHAVATVPMDAWPQTTVNTRWLEKLVTDVPTALVRTIKAQHRLIPRREARERGRIGLTYDKANIISRETKGAVSTGEDEAQASAAQRTLDDLLDGAGGDMPTLRILVSSRSKLDLEDARSLMTEQAEEAGVTRLKWHDYRHHQAMVLCAPFGRGVAV